MPSHAQAQGAAAGDVLYSIASILDPIRPSELFPCEQRLELELGSGDGSFLAQYASCNPGTNFLGIERLKGRAVKLAKRAARGNLRNVRCARIESSYFVRYLLPPCCIDAIHIYFPDPWPKRKHWSKRLITESFARSASAVLKQAGRVYIRTDSSDYFEWMVNAFSSSLLFDPIITPPELLQVHTDFEREFLARGIPTLQAAFARKP